MYGNAFLSGVNATWYSANSTTCFTNALSLYQYDVELMLIKYMYGDLEDIVLNSTLFLKNVSDVGYVCIDAGENLYAYSLYRFE